MRDRWQRVRDLMARDALDVIVAPPHTGHHDHFSAYSRYLTGLGGYSFEVGAVFPLDGAVTAIVVPDVSIEKWRAQQDWVSDIRTSGRAFGDGIIARLTELGLTRARIGLAGLTGVPRFADGIVAHGFYCKLRDAFPRRAIYGLHAFGSTWRDTSRGRRRSSFCAAASRKPKRGSPHFGRSLVPARA